MSNKHPSRSHRRQQALLGGFAPSLEALTNEGDDAGDDEDDDASSSNDDKLTTSQ